MFAVAMPPQRCAASPSAAHCQGPPMAAAAVDINRDGRANFWVIGADRNRDGVPDACQRTAQQTAPSPAFYANGRPQHAAASPPTAPVLLGAFNGHPPQVKPASAVRQSPAPVVRGSVSSASCDAAAVASVVCLIASISTIGVGLVYVVLKLLKITLEFSSCDFFDETCNQTWRNVFTFRPSVLFTLWTPTFLGIVGASVHFQSLRLCSLFDQIAPATYTQYAWFMLLTALVGNIGYLGQCGVIIGIYSLVAALVCIVVRLIGHIGIKTIG